MYILNRNLSEKFESFAEAVEVAKARAQKKYGTPQEWIVKETPKGWSVKAKVRRHYNHCTYGPVQTIQEI